MPGILRAGSISIPNGSFESPATFFVSINFNNWQKTPKWEGWNETNAGPWNNLTGIFTNDARSVADYITNCHGTQAAWLFANPEVGLFQDYDSQDWNDPVPTHDFDARFEPGKFYRLKFGLVGFGGGMQPGVPLEVSLYYRDEASNQVVVAATIVTNSSAYFSNRIQLVDFQVVTPVVQPGDAWANQHIGIRLLSIVDTNLAGGYWDVDNVRLASVTPPALTNLVHASRQFQFTVQGEAGEVYEILSSTNPATALPDWTSLGTVSNATGSFPFIDTLPDLNQRFYLARQLP